MSGLDVEALLDSTAANDVKDSPRGSDDRHRSDRSDRRDKDKRRDGSRDRDRDRKRRDRSRDHRRDRDEEMKSPRSDHGSANGSHKSSKRRSRSRDRDDDRRRSKRDEDYHRRRSRSPGDDRYYRPSGGRSKRDDEDHDRRDRDRDRERRRSASPKKRVKSKTPEPQLTEDERDRRTVFVQQLAARLRTKELIQFFEKVGAVNEAQIVKDRVSGRSKGYVLRFSTAQYDTNVCTV